MDNVSEIVGQVRDHVNQGRIKYHLMKNRDYWLQLCSCMDTLEDTEFAIDAYLADSFVTGSGKAYLSIYGLLQALFLQQDAAIHLREALLREGLDFYAMLDEYPDLKDIREVRNDSIGHPTKRGKKAPYTYHFIPRVSLSHDDFQLMVTSGDGTYTPLKHISIPRLVTDQRRYVSSMLTAVLTNLKQDDAAHKEKFKMDKLAPIFAQSHYLIEKVYEGVLSDEQAQLGAGHLRLLEKQLEGFRDKLAERGIELETYDSIKLVYQQLKYPLDKLKVYFRGADDDESSIDSRTAEIFVEYVDTRLGRLEEMAGEIDKDYLS